MRTHVSALRIAAARMIRASNSTGDRRRRLVLRLGAYKVLATMARKMDWLARLRVLEGAAGIPHQSRAWVNRFQSPNAQAREAINGAFDNLDPDWLAPRDTHLYSDVLKYVRGILARTDQDVSVADDIVQDELLGLGKNLSSVQGNFYGAGKQHRGGINNGDEGPRAMAGPVNRRMTVRYEANYLRDRKTETNVFPEGRTNLQDIFTEDIYRPLYAALTDPDSDIGREIRSYMRSFWEKPRKTKGGKPERKDTHKNRVKVMDGWLRRFVADGSPPDPRTLATKFGLSRALVSRYIANFVEDFKDKFWTERRDLVADLELLLETEYASRPWGVTANSLVKFKIVRMARCGMCPEDRAAMYEKGKPVSRKTMEKQVGPSWGANIERYEGTISVEDEDDDHLGRYEKGKPVSRKKMEDQAGPEWGANIERYEGTISAEDDDIEAMFEEGKPADPTENMSPADAKKWQSENKRNRDRFKHASRDEVIETRNGVVMFSEWAKGHILKGHSQPGKGSVFERKALGLISKVIPRLSISPSQGVYETSASGVGYDLVWPTRKILKHFPDATETTAQKDEGRSTVTVNAYQVGEPLRSFKTNKLSIVIRPTTDAKFIPGPLKNDPRVMSALEDGSLYAVLSAWPGRGDVPRASEWGDRYAIVLPAGTGRRARFERGVPADPTVNMSPEQKAKWEAMKEEYGDKFKAAGWGGTTMATKDLPKGVQKGLRSLGYRRRSIDVRAAATYSPQSVSGSGSRALVAIIDFRSGLEDREYGSWGGANMFESRGPDRRQPDKPTPRGKAIFIGTSGGKVWGSLTVNPEDFTNLGGAAGAETQVLSDMEEKALMAIVPYNSRGRRDEFERQGLGTYGLNNPLVQALIQKGMLKARGRGVVVLPAARNYRSESPFLRSLKRLIGKSFNEKIAFLRDAVFDQGKGLNVQELAELRRAWRNEDDYEMVIDYLTQHGVA